MAVDIATPNSDIIGDVAQALTDTSYTIQDSIVYAASEASDDAQNAYNSFKQLLGGSVSGSPGDFDPNNDRTTILSRERIVKDKQGNHITDIDSIEQTSNGQIMFVEEKSANWAIHPQEWAQKHIFDKGASYVNAIENGVNLEYTPSRIAFRFTGGTLDPTLQTAVENAFSKLQQTYPNYSFELMIP